MASLLGFLRGGVAGLGLAVGGVPSLLPSSSGGGVFVFLLLLGSGDGLCVRVPFAVRDLGHQCGIACCLPLKNQ